ncbi:septation protein IspZ [uncultured Phenylobacterium sp.]|uniref:inner membrane-spanning protein YciB n=1 Tax=uncultured Phenylobacterium sp. TaxID=349273 RepID=UPI0025E57264|nr:septation protein IspZ [uncultured Phenylobacterium sp.]
MTQRTRDWIRYFVDYSALVVFLVAYFLTGRNIANATWALVAGSAIALLVGLAVERRLAPFPLIAGGAALVFGGASLFFHDPRILKIKPTVMNGFFAVLLLGGMALGKNPMRLLLGDAFNMPDATWRRLTINYAALFLGLAALNEFVWRTQPEATWVLFRFPGMMVLTVAFSLAHTPLLMKYVKADELPPPPTE